MLAAPAKLLLSAVAAVLGRTGGQAATRPVALVPALAAAPVPALAAAVLAAAVTASVPRAIVRAVETA
jgi:hypothetical protein